MVGTILLHERFLLSMQMLKVLNPQRMYLLYVVLLYHIVLSLTLLCFTQTSLFLSSLSPSSTESCIRNFVSQSLPSLMASKPNAIRSIVHVAKSRCAFVNFTDRADAESAALAWGAGLEISVDREICGSNGVRRGEERTEGERGLESCKE